MVLSYPGRVSSRRGCLSAAKKGKSWLEIVVDVSDEALIQLQGMDPLGD